MKKGNLKIANIAFKVILISLFLFIIYRQVFVKNDVSQMMDEFIHSINNNNPFLLIIVIALMLLNWSLEALKWQSIISKFEYTPFIKAIKTIMTGIATGIITPAKLGEYLGRVLLIESKNNWKAVWATFISSIAQNIATFFFGVFGLLYLLKNYYDIESYIINSTFYLGLICIIVILFLYYNIDLALKIIKRLGLTKIVNKISNGDNIKEFVDVNALNKVLIFSVLRYLVFALQYYLLLIFFGISGDSISLFAGISAVYIIQTSIPLPPITNIFARGEIAILIFGHFTDNKIMILSSTFSLWLINLLIPAFVGLIIIIRINVAKSLGYD
jgi:hypothetical protein